MQYMLLIHADEAKMPTASSEAVYQMSNNYAVYTDALRKAGALVSGDRLKPSGTARTVTVRDKGAEVLDGPFADIKEQLGGYFVIEASDMDDAVAWAQKCPGASIGSIEVRPVWGAMIPKQ